MGEISIIGLDIAKQVFHAHGADATGATVFIAVGATMPRLMSAIVALGIWEEWVER
ncbi:MAG TPA: hypothetical protein VG900_16490 [Hyphomicrobiaceae bacterium]|nr:hypothetical protein [Hyphomicrobiaceae bacterium]